MKVDEAVAPPFGVRALLDKAQDAMRVSRVFGEPYEKDGAMIIPVAAVRGGGGGGGDAREEHAGEGGGFGLSARPVGVYVVRGGETSWKPSVDVNRIAALGSAVTAFLIFAVWRVQKARAGAAA
jgi:uncharacterized spore protein YtfJ